MPKRFRVGFDAWAFSCISNMPIQCLGAARCISSYHLLYGVRTSDLRWRSSPRDPSTCATWYIPKNFPSRFAHPVARQRMLMGVGGGQTFTQAIFRLYVIDSGLHRDFVMRAAPCLPSQVAYFQYILLFIPFCRTWGFVNALIMSYSNFLCFGSQVVHFKPSQSSRARHVQSQMEQCVHRWSLEQQIPDVCYDAYIAESLI